MHMRKFFCLLFFSVKKVSCISFDTKMSSEGKNRTPNGLSERSEG